MGARVSIGDFSIMAHLSRKALRHYHELGILEPATSMLPPGTASMTLVRLTKHS